MAVKHSLSFLVDADKQISEGSSLSQVAKHHGVSAAKLAEALRRNGLGGSIRPQCQAKDLPNEQLLRLYREGRSVLEISRTFTTTRRRVASVLRQLGESVRGKREAHLLRLQKMSFEERQQMTSAMKVLITGRKLPAEDSIKQARTKELRGTQSVGLFENELTEALRKRGFSVRQQAAFGRYSVDLLINESVAVELYSGAHRYLGVPKNLKRVEDLRDLGLSVLVMLFTRRAGRRRKKLGVVDTVTAHADKLVADLHEMCGNPPSLSEYRMVRCGLERNTARDENGKMTSPGPAVCTYHIAERDLRVAG